MRTFFKLNNGLGHVVIRVFLKVCKSPTRLGMRAFHSSQGVTIHLYDVVFGNYGDVHPLGAQGTQQNE